LIVYLGLWSLTKSFSEFNSVNTQKTKEIIRKQAEENIQHIRKNFETALLKRARVTLEKDAIFIQRMMEENSFNSLRDFIVQFAKNDSSVVYGAFWVVENNTLGAWQVVNLQVPSGLDMPITWDAEKKGWQGLLKGEPQFVPDLDVEAYNDLTEPKVRIVSKSQSDGNSDSSQYVDAVIPIASGMSVSSVKATRASGSAIGYLKYQFSMREMEEQIQKEQTVLEASLKDIETANQKAAEKLNDLAIEKSLFLTGILFLVGVGIVIVVTIISRHFSLRVTKPIEQLTNVAAEMVRGKYEQAIAIESDDEIGLFADTFQELSSAIVQRDNELASINKDLEHKVEERTEQLSKELNTTANLLNNMKQAVFSVDSNGLIIPPVSRSAYTIFGGAIEGQSDFSSLQEPTSLEPCNPRGQRDDERR
jgi:nitrogen fixation/metabolism regulation signal transduction histidine kinase